MSSKKEGGKKFDSNKPDFTLIPIEAMEECSKAFMYGEKKYGRYNFTGGLTVNRLLGAALRHMYQAMWKEDNDPESNEHHLGHALASISMAIYMIKNRKDLDDRFIKVKDNENDTK